MKKHIILILSILIFAAIAVTIVYFVNENDKKMDAQKISFSLVLKNKVGEIREPVVRSNNTDLLSALKQFSKEQPEYFPFVFDKTTEKISSAGHILSDEFGEIVIYHNIADETLYDVDCGDQNCDGKTCKNIIKLGDVIYRLSSKKPSELPIQAGARYFLCYMPY